MSGAVTLALGKLTHEDHEFQASLAYITKPCIKNKKSGMITHAANPSPGETEAGRFGRFL